MDNYGGAAKGVKLDLKPCKFCGRTFVPESLVKHQGSCKNVQKKRKVFDTSKQRVTEDLSLKQIKAAQKKAVKPQKSHWKQKHEEFIRNIRAAKGAQIAIDRGDPLPPPPPPSENPDYVSCPYCNRRFNEKAAERHINFCKDQQKRLPAKREPTAQEKARHAASKYQPPKPKVRGASQPVEPPCGGGYGGGSGYSGGSGGSGYSGGRGYGAPPKGGPGARAPPPGGRAGLGGPPGSRSDMGRAPAGYGSSSTAARGRAPVGGAARGRQAPASQGSYAGRYGR